MGHLRKGWAERPGPNPKSQPQHPLIIRRPHLSAPPSSAGFLPLGSSLRSSNTTEVTRLPPRHSGTWSSPERGSGLGAAPRPGSYANRGDVPAASSHPEGGHSGEPAPPWPQARKRKDQRLKGNSSAVRAFFLGCAAPLLPAQKGQPVFGRLPSIESCGQSSFLQSPLP